MKGITFLEICSDFIFNNFLKFITYLFFSSENGYELFFQQNVQHSFLELHEDPVAIGET
jgi:hypothetical protein